MKRIVYKQDETAFLKTLNARANDYFKNSAQGKCADWRTFEKATILIVLFIFCMAWSIFTTSFVSRSAAMFISGILMTFLVYNVVHDAIHGSFFRSRKLNRAAAYLHNFFGYNCRIFQLRHLHGHHAHPHVLGVDLDLAIVGMGLNKKETEGLHKKLQTCAIILMPLVLGFYAFLCANFADAGREAIGNKILKVNRLKEHFISALSKLFALGYLVVLPFFFGCQEWYKLLVPVMVYFFAAGLTTYIIGLPVHILDENKFYVQPSCGQFEHTWVEHQFLTTNDFKTRSKILSYLFGGFNHHLAHHFFPSVAHCHYPHLTPIIQQTAREFNMPYLEVNSLSHAIDSHYSLILKRSRQESFGEIAADMLN